MFILLMLEAVGLAAYTQAFVFRSWLVMLFLWFGAVTLQHVSGWDRRLKGAQRMKWFACSSFFPLAITLWKRYQITHLATEYGGIPNRLQHLAWSFCLVGMLLPLLVRWWVAQPRWSAWLMGVCVVALFGNVAELVEWLSDRAVFAADTSLALAKLTDTMLDITMNMIGALFGVILCFRSGSAEVRLRVRRTIA
jgi:hypothetical protein